LPLSRIVRLTSRGQRDFSLQAFGSAAMAPWRVIEWFLPRFNGNPASLGADAHWQYGLHQGDIVYIWCVTLGVLPLFAILAAAPVRAFWNRRTLFLSSAFLVALLFSFGTRLPFYRALYEVEWLRRLRYPIKFYLVATISAALLAGFASESLLANRSKRPLFVLAAGALVFLALLPLSSAGGPIAESIRPHLQGLLPSAAQLEAGILSAIRSDAMRGLGAIALLSLILLWGRSARLRAYLLGFATLVLALPWGLPLFVAADTRDLSRPPAVLAALSGPGRVYASDEIGKVKLSAEEISHPHLEPRYARLARVLIEELTPATGAAFGVRYLFDEDPDGSYGFSNRLAREVLQASTPDQKARMLAAYGARWVLSAESAALPQARPVTGFTVAGRRLVLWELPGAVPELRWAGRAHGRRSLSGALELVRQEGFRPEIEIVLPDRQDRGPAGRTSAARLSDVRLRPARAAAQVRADGPGWLVLSRTYFPAWRATVDGTPARVLIANGRDLAVPVPAGTHRVELWWDETPFARGVGLQAAGVLLVAAAALLGARAGSAGRRKPEVPRETGASVAERTS
jgi:hypothetical protein